jgi:hypothetical protein
VRRLSELQRASYVGQFNGIGVIPRIVVLAEIGGCVEDHVNPSKIVSEIGYVAGVPYDLASGSVAEFPPRFFLGPSQCPNLVTGLQKNAH